MNNPLANILSTIEMLHGEFFRKYHFDPTHVLIGKSLVGEIEDHYEYLQCVGLYPNKPSTICGLRLVEIESNYGISVGVIV